MKESSGGSRTLKGGGLGGHGAGPLVGDKGTKLPEFWVWSRVPAEVELFCLSVIVLQ